MLKKFIYILIAVVLLINNSAVLAITIDNFNDVQSESAGVGTNLNTISSKLDHNNRPNSIGGYRTLEVEGLVGSGFFQTRSVIDGGVLYQSQDSATSGITTVTWDGDDQDTFDPTGLGGLDFYQDGSDRFVFHVVSYDAPHGKSIDLELIVYSGVGQSSVHPLTLDHAISSAPDAFGNIGEYFELEYQNFVQAVGASQPADFNSITAVQLVINGFEEDVDLTVDFFGTNGCDLVPDMSGSVVDQCGVCGGDDSACTDCLGVINGDAETDRCGVCEGDGNSCLGCNLLNQEEVLIRLDSGAKAQEEHIKKLFRQVKLVSQDIAAKRFVQKFLAKASELQNISWNMVWSMPSEINQCTNQSLCQQLSFETTINDYEENSLKLKKIGKKLLRLIKRNAPHKRKRYRGLFRNNNLLHKNNLKNLKDAASYQSIC